MNDTASLRLRNQLRQKMKQKRQSLAPAQRERYNKQIQQYVYEYFAAHPSIQTVMSYFPIQNEAVPLPHKTHLPDEKISKTLLLPRVVSLDPPQLIAVPYRGEHPSQGTYTSWGIFEPFGSATMPYQIDCVLVPGLAFDTHGYRLGYGKGFYDRYLPLLRSDTVTIGIGYHFQLTRTTWPQPHDQKLDAFITEKGVIAFETFYKSFFEQKT